MYNEKYLKDYTLYDKKVLVIEILDQPDQSNPNQILLLVKKWDIIKFELSIPTEVMINKENTTMNELCIQLSPTFNIDVIKLL